MDKLSLIVLYVLLLMSIINQWQRYLLPYLSGVSISECPSKEESQICFEPSNAKTVTLCEACPSNSSANYWPQCERCLECLIENQAQTKNLRYGACISSAEYGILAGFGFSLLYVVFGLFAGRLTDVFNRKTIIFASLVVSSLATTMHGFANDFVFMLSARVLLGIGQAFASPPAYSLIADLFSQEYRATANGIFSFGVYLGGGLSSLSILMAQKIGWEKSTFVAGGVGMGVSVLILLFVREPPRKATQKSHQLTHISALRSIWLVLSEPVIVMVFIASALRFIGGFTLGAYLPIFYSRVFPNFNTQYSILNSGVVSVGGALSAYLGGTIADNFSKKNPRYRAWIPAIGALMGLVPFAVTMFFDNFYLSIAGLFFEYLFAECWFGPTISIIQNHLPANLHGIAIALFIFFGEGPGGNIGPAIVGLLDPGTAQIRSLLFTVLTVSYVGCAVFFFITSFFIKDTGEVEIESQSEPLFSHASSLE